VPRRRHSSLDRASQIGVINLEPILVGVRIFMDHLINKSLVLPEKKPGDKQRPPKKLI
jgi:hypothetical protein